MVTAHAFVTSASVTVGAPCACLLSSGFAQKHSCSGVLVQVSMTSLALCSPLPQNIWSMSVGKACLCSRIYGPKRCARAQPRYVLRSPKATQTSRCRGARTPWLDDDAACVRSSAYVAPFDSHDACPSAAGTYADETKPGRISHTLACSSHPPRRRRPHGETDWLP